MNKKIISIVAAFCFLCNDPAFALSPWSASNTPSSSTRTEMIELGKKLFAAKRGPGAIDFDSYRPGRFAGNIPRIPSASFIPATYSHLPEAWKNNPILAKTDLIEALKYFRDEEAGIGDNLSIKEGYFEVDGKKGELPIARIEQAKDGKVTLVLHTKFVQNWNHIRQNDVWFRYAFTDGKKRTVSLAWAIFYRLAKHEMSDLRKADIMPKGGGHIDISYSELSGGPIFTEDAAKDIGGRYAFVNDSVWMWFLGSYCFDNATRYDNGMLEKRLRWFLDPDSREAAALDLKSEFPNLIPGTALAGSAIDLALAINYRFFSRPKIVVPETTVAQGLIDDYLARNISIEKTVYATGTDDTVPAVIAPAQIPEPAWGAYSGQAAHIWFDAEMRIVVKTDPRVFRGLGLNGRELEEVSNNLGRAIRKAYTYLSMSEKQSLFKFQKENKIQRHTGEWMELPLPIRIEGEMSQMAMVTPHEIVLSMAMARAPPAVLALVLNHAFRRSINRFKPDEQLHDAAIFQKTLELILAKPELRIAWNDWLTPDKEGIFYGRQWNAPIRHADEIIRIEEAWHEFLNDSGAAKDIYHRLVHARTDQAAVDVVGAIFRTIGSPAPSRVYRETYLNSNHTKSRHFYIVYEIGDGLNKVIRIAPRATQDWIATEDAAINYEFGGLRLDIVRDTQRWAGDIVDERAIYAKYPNLLRLIDRVNSSPISERDRAIGLLSRWSLEQATETADRARAASDILFGFAKTHPDFNVRVKLNRFVFDRATERPAEFPQATFNYSAFDRDGYTVKVETRYEDLPREVRVRWNQNGSEVRDSEILKPFLIDPDKKTASYEWKVPGNKGWINYAFQSKDPVMGKWEYTKSDLDIQNPQNPYARVNGIIKFQEDVRGRRLIGVRPEVFNLRLDGSKPMVDENGNIQTGTLKDLNDQLQSIKAQGFDEIYIQALEMGAPGEAGPDASPFSPLDQIRISSGIGGMKGLLELKKTADKLGLAIALDMIPHGSRSDRESSPRTPVWVVDAGSGKLVRRAASDGGLSPEWLDGFMRNWADPRNLRDYIDQLSTLARFGFDFRIDVAHVFDTTIETRHELTGPAKVYGYVTTNTMNTLDLRGTQEPNSVLAAIIYQVKKAGLDKGYSTKFFGENWHGNEPRLIQAGVDFPYDPLVANFWNIIRKGRSTTHEFVGTVRWLRGIWERFGGGTVTTLYSHDAEVPVVDAFGSAAFSATGALIFASGGVSFQHLHYSYRNPDGSINWEKLYADHWRVYVNNFGPARSVNGIYWAGAENIWRGKTSSTEHALWINKHLADLGNFSRRIHELTVSSKPGRKNEGPANVWPIPLDVGHDRVVGIAREVDNETLIGLFHMGSPYAADVNFHPNKSKQWGAGVNDFDDEAIYKLEEIFNNEKPSVTKAEPGDSVFFSGHEINQLGIGPRFPIPIFGIRVYRLVKVSQAVAALEPDQYRMLLKDSIERYHRYGPKDRTTHCPVALEILRAAKSGLSDFSKLFAQLSSIAAENPSIVVGDLSSIFHDVLFYNADVRSKIHEYLVSIAVLSSSDSPLESETAIKVLRGSGVGEIVFSSPESIWSSGTGGMALYVTDLAKQLAALGVDVTVITPMFADNKSEIFRKFSPRDTGRTITIPFDNGGYKQYETAKIYEKRQSGVRILYLENDERFTQLSGKRGDEKSAYDGSMGYRFRFARMLSLGTLLAAREMNIHPSVIHTNEWSTAYVKAYLDGYGREDLNDKHLRDDPHFAGTEVVSVGHNLQRGYQGRMQEPDPKLKDMTISLDLGLKPGEWEALVSKGDWSLNPTFTAVQTASHFLTVGGGYHDRSLDWRYSDEFGGLTPVFQWKDNVGGYSAIPNGFGLVEWQKKLFGFSFFDIGHEEQRRLRFKELLDTTLPKQKKKLQKAFNLREDGPGFEAFLDVMLHRIDPQKGHQLLLAEIWKRDAPGIVKSFSGFFEDMDNQITVLSAKDKKALIDYADRNGRVTLRAIEVLLILVPDAQYVVAGPASDQYFIDGFSDVRYKFPEQFRYHASFVQSTDERYGQIYSGASVFDMPSQFEPGGLSNKEAAAAGTVRHTTNRDGLKDSVINLPMYRAGERSVISEGFEPFNPVAWFTSLRSLYRVFKEDRELWNEIRYTAITQDNRWLRHVKMKDGYLPLYVKVSKQKDDFELRALEVTAAIHRAGIQHHRDPADELMKEGFVPAEAVEQLLKALEYSKNDVLTDYLIKEQIPFLGKVSQATFDLLQTGLKKAIAHARDEKSRDLSERALKVLSLSAKSLTADSVTADSGVAAKEAAQKETQPQEAPELTMVISEFAVKLGLDKGPGALTVEEKAAWEKTLLSVWQSTNLLSSNRIEMFIPQNIKLTDPMKTALSDLRKHKGQDVIECKEYSGESHLQRLLMQSAPQGVSRIIVSERTLKNMNIGKLAEENPALFVGVRLVNIALPAVYDTMDVREKSIHQSKLIMFTILARLYEGNKTSAVGVLLQAMLKDMLDIDTDTGEFMTKLVESQDESSDPIRAKDRILYCLSKVVGLVEKLGTEIRLMKEFWTAA